MDKTAHNPLSFLEALHSAGPTTDRAEKLALYAWLVGSWDMDVVVYKDESFTQTLRGNVCAGWVLQGRAIQDVFTVPGLFYGTSLRFYDPTSMPGRSSGWTP